MQEIMQAINCAQWLKKVREQRPLVHNIAGEVAAVEAKGPGTFQANLFDALYNLDPEQVQQRANISIYGE